MKIKINFCDFWPDFADSNLFFSFLKEHFNVIIDDDPDYLFFSGYGDNHLKYQDCVKIFFTGENTIPDFNICDYAIGFHYLDFEDRYLRFPLYVYYQWYYKNFFSVDYSNTKVDEFLLNRKFCNFVYSNKAYADPIRDLFFKELCKYKKVDSGGKHLNNIGIPVRDKLEFIKNYKFTIAFENSSVPGYTTEKLLEPFLVRSMPIYFGNPLVFKDFNIEYLVEVKDNNDIHRAIDEIVYLDENDNAYLKKLNYSELPLNKNIQIWEKLLLTFFKNIFLQPLEEAYRKPKYGFTKFYFDEMSTKYALLRKMKNKNRIKSNIKKIITRKY